MTESAALQALQRRLGHHFARPTLLVQALTHRSFGAEHNERLEFLGDAVLSLGVSALLYERFSGSEARITRAMPSRSSTGPVQVLIWPRSCGRPSASRGSLVIDSSADSRWSTSIALSTHSRAAGLIVARKRSE